MFFSFLLQKSLQLCFLTLYLRFQIYYHNLMLCQIVMKNQWKIVIVL